MNMVITRAITTARFIAQNMKKGTEDFIPIQRQKTSAPRVGIYPIHLNGKPSLDMSNTLGHY